MLLLALVALASAPSPPPVERSTLTVEPLEGDRPPSADAPVVEINPLPSSPYGGRVRAYGRLPAIAGGLLVAGGVASFVVAKGYASELRGGDVRTHDDRVHLVEDGKRLQRVGLGMLVAGGVGLAIASTLYFLDPPPKEFSFLLVPFAGGTAVAWTGSFQ